MTLIWQIIFSIVMGVGLGSVIYFFIMGALWLIRKILGFWFVEHKKYHQDIVSQLNYEMGLMNEINELKQKIATLENKTQWLEAKHKENK